MDQVYTTPGANGRSSPTDLHQPKRVGETRPLTDLGNAERFVDDHKRHARFCYAWNTWLVFDGRRWAVDDAGDVDRLMQETVRGIYSEAAHEPDGTEKRKALAAHAVRSESRKRISDALHLARSALAVRPDELDRDPYLLNCENGTVDLRTGMQREHDRNDFITKLAPAPFDLHAQAPTFDAFLEKILPTPALRNFVQTVIGYAAIGENTEEILTIPHGHGANGKSTLFNAVMQALGDYSAQAPPDLLLAKNGAHPTELADLFGRRLVAAVESDDGRRLNEGLVKQLTGRDRIKARRMREDFWQFDPTHTLFFATNHRPEVRGTDYAIWRRLKLVPFDVQIPPEEQDKKLPRKLREELPGILAWIVRGALMYQRLGLPEPEEVRVATEGYREEMDVLAAFLEDRCVVHPRASVGATPLYNAYKEWCEESGEHKLTQTKFGRRLKERGFRNEKYQRVTWYGVGLRDDSPDPDGDLDSSRDRQEADTPREGPDSGADGLRVDGRTSNDLNGESRINKGESPSSDRELREFRPESDMNGINAPHEASISENRLNRLKHLAPAGDTRRVVCPHGEHPAACIECEMDQAGL